MGVGRVVIGNLGEIWNGNGLGKQSGFIAR